MVNKMKTVSYGWVVLLLFCLNASAQKRAKYEFKRNLPVYADSLIADFNYPLAWAGSGINDFETW